MSSVGNEPCVQTFAILSVSLFYKKPFKARSQRNGLQPEEAMLQYFSKCLPDSSLACRGATSCNSSRASCLGAFSWASSWVSSCLAKRSLAFPASCDVRLLRIVTQQPMRLISSLLMLWLNNQSGSRLFCDETCNIQSSRTPPVVGFQPMHLLSEECPRLSIYLFRLLIRNLAVLPTHVEQTHALCGAIA